MNKFFVSALVSAMLFSSGSIACPEIKGEPPTEENLSIANSTFSYSTEGKNPTLTTLGTIKNTASGCLSDVTVEIKYFDANKAMIDTVTQSLYGVVVPAHGEVAFRVQESPSKLKDSYVSQSVRIISAEAKQGRLYKSSSAGLWEQIISWGPLFIFLATLLFLLRRMQKVGGPQQRFIQLYEEQNGILSKQNALLAQIVTAVESPKKL